MGSERRIRLVIHIVLDQKAPVRQAEIFQGLLQDAISRPIGGHKIHQGRALGRGIFKVPHVEIDSAGIGEKSAVAGRFIMPAMMTVQDPSSLHMKDVIAQLMRHGGRRVFRMILIDEQPVLGFKTENSIQHVMSRGPA